MINKKRSVNVSDRDVYDKLNALNFINEVPVTSDKWGSRMHRIIKNINKNGKVIELEPINQKYCILRRVGPVNYNMYLREKIKRF